jgi:copper(I)-binding protein
VAFSGPQWIEILIGTEMKKLFATLLIASAPVLSWAQALQVDKAWIRATVPGQQGTGGFMTLMSKDGVTLTGASVDAALGIAELHEMAMEGDVMKMRAIDKLAVPAGKAVELKPGGHHLMLVGLKAPLAKGSKVSVTFHYKDAKCVAGKQVLSIPVETAAPGKAAMPEHHGHKH